MLDLPWEFVTLGTPASVQAGSPTRKRWQMKVVQAAEAALPSGVAPLPSEHKVQIHIIYYYDGARLDVDNMLKPIQDALIGIAYEDDDQIIDTHGYVRDLNSPYKIRGMSRCLADGFSSGDPFVHVRIEWPGDIEELP